MTFPESTYPVLASERTVYIDGVPMDEVAALSGSTEKLEYEDVCLYFDKTPDEFTPNMFKGLLAALYRSRMDHISLWDNVTGGLTASKNHALANTPNHYLMFEYLFEDQNPFKEEAILSENAIDAIVAVMKMDKALISDVDRERAKEILDYFESKGCEKFDDLKELIDIFIQTPTRADIYGPRMDRLNSSLVCQYGTIIKAFKQYSASFDGLTNVRQKNKNVTYTNFDRMISLQSFLQMAAETFAKEPRRFNNVLIVGPGLEQMNPKLREKVPRQSFEPFAVIDWLAQNGLTNVADINVDLVDINDRVVEYFDGVVQRGIESGYLKLYCTSATTGRFGSGLAGMQTTRELPGAVTALMHPEIIKRLKATNGDIITDHIAPDETYDMVVILNTFMYFTPEEKVIALENISRLLTSGGVLITDVEQESVSKHSQLTPLPFSNVPSSNIQAYKKE